MNNYDDESDNHIKITSVDDINNDTNNNQKILMKKYKPPNNWVPDDSVDKCLNCKISFGIITPRKHHCRLCGYIFCSDCLQYKQKVPKEMLPPESVVPTTNDYFYGTQYDEKRLCVTCNNLIIKMKHVEKIMKTFEIIELDIMELHKASTKNALWKDAADICLIKIENIQLKLSFDKYTQSECKILWNNAKYFSNHSSYLVMLFRICKTDEQVQMVLDIIDKKEPVIIESHENLMCKQNKCCNTLTSFDAINILVNGINNNCDLLKKTAFKYLKCNDNEFKCYIPLIVYNIKFDMAGILIDELIKRCTKNLNLLNAVHLELNNYVSDINEDINYKVAHEKLIKCITQDNDKYVSAKILQSKAFVEIIKKIGKTVCEENKQVTSEDFTLTTNLMYPLDISKNISKIHVNDIKIKESATKPIIIPCETTNETKTHLMYKKDDLRQDQIMMHIINLVNIIIKKDLGIDLSLITYNVLPICKNSGIIEIVDNSDTVYHIQEKLKNNILNYIMDKNPQWSIEKLRTTYVKSIAGYSVVTYLFGVGDRHLDNIMINRDARLFHIDYGFILGRDPIFNNPGIRITPDMINAVGGFSSQYYVEFQQLSTQIYNSLRNHIDIFITMLMFLQKITGNVYTENEIKTQVLKRFLPGESVIDAKFHLVDTMEKQSVTDRIKDFCHFHNKEKTISSGVSRIAKACDSFISGVTGYLNPKQYHNK